MDYKSILLVGYFVVQEYTYRFYVATSPWFFTRGGDVALSHGTLRDIGRGGFYWSSTIATSITNAYDFVFDIGVYPSIPHARYLGFSVRCVASGYYVRSGMVNMYHGKYLNVNNQSNLWSGKADQTDAAHGAFMMIISANQIAPAYSNYEWVGFLLRCLVW